MYTITNLIGGNLCEGIITLKPTRFFTNRPTLNFIQNQTLVAFDIRDLIASSPSGLIECQSSIDRGNTSGFNFIPSAGRSLFWVHHTTSWDDPANWSLTSGGPTGECIPTLLDSVVFDENSFPTGIESVFNGNNINAYCKDFVFDAPGYTGNFDLSTLYVGRNFQMKNDAPIRIAFVYTVGITELQHFNSKNATILYLELSGSADVILDEDATIREYIGLIRGRFLTNDKVLTTGSLQLNGSFYTPTLVAGTSKIILTRSLSYPSSALYVGKGIVDASNSAISFTGDYAGIYLASNLSVDLGEVVFENINGTGELLLIESAHIQKLEMRGNGEFIQSRTPNSLNTSIKIGRAHV